jgi:hypothetical protein
MDGLPHFPMSEDPDRLRNYLLLVVDRVAAKR